jgi:hypothetical protein
MDKSIPGYVDPHLFSTNKQYTMTFAGVEIAVDKYK